MVNEEVLAHWGCCAIGKKLLERVFFVYIRDVIVCVVSMSRY
jgi:hypothetical protein